MWYLLDVKWTLFPDPPPMAAIWQETARVSGKDRKARVIAANNVGVFGVGGGIICSHAPHAPVAR